MAALAIGDGVVDHADLARTVVGGSTRYPQVLLADDVHRHGGLRGRLRLGASQHQNPTGRVVHRAEYIDRRVLVGTDKGDQGRRSQGRGATGQRDSHLTGGFALAVGDDVLHEVSAGLVGFESETGPGEAHLLPTQGTHLRDRQLVHGAQQMRGQIDSGRQTDLPGDRERARRQAGFAGDSNDQRLGRGGPVDVRDCQRDRRPLVGGGGRIAMLDDHIALGVHRDPNRRVGGGRTTEQQLVAFRIDPAVEHRHSDSATGSHFRGRPLGPAGIATRRGAVAALHAKAHCRGVGVAALSGGAVAGAVAQARRSGGAGGDPHRQALVVVGEFDGAEVGVQLTELLGIDGEYIGVGVVVIEQHRQVHQGAGTDAELIVHGHGRAGLAHDLGAITGLGALLLIEDGNLPVLAGGHQGTVGQGPGPPGARVIEDGAVGGHHQLRLSIIAELMTGVIQRGRGALAPQDTAAFAG